MKRQGGIRTRSPALPLFLLLLGLYLLLARGYPFYADEQLMLDTTRNLVDHGRVDCSSHPWLTKAGWDGRQYSNYGIGQSLWEIPFLLLGRGLARLPGWTTALAVRTALSGSAALLIAGTCLLAWVLAGQLGYSDRSRTAYALLLGAGTMLLPYSRSLFRDPLQLILLMGALVAAVQARRSGRSRDAALAGAALGLSILTKEATGIYALPIGLYLLLTLPRSRKLPLFLCFGVPVALGTLGTLGYNWLRFRALLDFGYSGHAATYGFSTPLWHGLQGLLISSGKGLLTHHPILLVTLGFLPALLRRSRAEGWLLIGTSALAVVFHARFMGFAGGWTWGPRYLLPVVPLMLLPIAELWDGAPRGRWLRWTATGLILLTAGIALLGTFVPALLFLNVVARDVHLFPIAFEDPDFQLRSDLVHTVFIPEFSPIWGHWWLGKHMLLRALRGEEHPAREAMRADCPWGSLSNRWLPEHPERALSIGPDLLWVAWGYEGATHRPQLALLALADLILMAWAARTLVRRCRR